MTSADVRDMLDLPNDRHSKPKKKQKLAEKRPEGINRELFALYGERLPPVAITEQIKFKKEGPKRSYKASSWEMTPFENPARTDGLVLRHWKKKDASVAAFPTTPGDSNVASEMEQDERTAKTEHDYYYAKFNVKTEGPEYTEEQYKSHLKSEAWSKEETDYLVDLTKEYDLRWIIIADRYEFQPSEVPSGDNDSMAVTLQPTPRTMEDMKARYYNVAAKTMVLHHPMSSMSIPEFDLHEKMTAFNPVLETTRKKLAEALQKRSPDEVKEEEILLGELKRIVGNEARFSQERKELYARLQAPQSTGSTQMYQSSHELTELMKTLLNVDKNNKKRRSLMGPGDGISSPSGQNFSDRAQRYSTSSTTGERRGTMSGPSGQRQLSSREQAKFGVTHHERLTAGVSFRHEKITKLSQAKSNVQSTKISAALTELKIPPRLVMPTTKVCNEYERLIGSIHVLLDVRKVSEKLEGEIRVLRAQKESLEGEDGDSATKPEQLDGQAPAEEDEEEGTKDEGEKDTENPTVEDSEAEDNGDEDEDEEEDDNHLINKDKEVKADSDNAEEEVEEDDAAPEPNSDPRPDSEEEDNIDADDIDNEDDVDVNDENEVEADPGDVQSRHPSIASATSKSAGAGGERGRKRSVSVMSGISTKSSKRPRK